MSVADPFKSLQLVPGRIPEVDLASYPDSNLDWNEGYISGLTLNEALALYWNLENLAVVFSATGTFLGNDALPVYVSVDFNETLVQGSPSAPKTRVCSPGWIASNSFGATETNGAFYDRSSEDGSGASYYQDVIGDFLPTASNGPEEYITKHTDGTYVFWLTFSIITDPAPARPQLLVGARGTQNIPGEFTSSTPLDTVDIAIGAAGNLRLKVWGVSDAFYGSPYTYDSSYSRTALTVTPNYYTYA